MQSRMSIVHVLLFIWREITELFTLAFMVLFPTRQEYQNRRGNGDGPQPQEPKKGPLNANCHFKELGLDKESCTEEDVKKSYRSLAREHHPDKNNNSEEVN